MFLISLDDNWGQTDDYRGCTLRNWVGVGVPKKKNLGSPSRPLKGTWRGQSAPAVMDFPGKKSPHFRELQRSARPCFGVPATDVDGVDSGISHSGKKSVTPNSHTKKTGKGEGKRGRIGPSCSEKPTRGSSTPNVSKDQLHFLHQRGAPAGFPQNPRADENVR
ncbi:hypothetical protein GWK47_002211 [Chionoecetes opilio]|uniref:Uncharacterized protein n=1 Tax=Chionoecetes opilio TaxID=41210 RepID=A0A8J4XTN3_CHIOP|nr:hypothetical protein GWK47_002211 [Chionoecetes opilio]